jgi:hypothetical protein
MKAIIYSTMFGVSFGGFVKMEEQLNSILANATGVDRAVGAFLGDSLQNINGYGCWCYFEEMHGKGKSHPVNDVDAFCKLLHEGYDCVMMDTEALGQDCVPWEIDYNTGASSLDTLVEKCHAKNIDLFWPGGEGFCATQSCIVESWFVQNIAQMFIGANALDESKRHTNGFVVDDECPTTKGEASEKSCCGVPPFRHPFKTYGGSRDCCGSKTFDVSLLICCGDGVNEPYKAKNVC